MGKREIRETKEARELTVTSSLSRLRAELLYHQSTTSGSRSSTPFSRPLNLEIRENQELRVLRVIPVHLETMETRETRVRREKPDKRDWLESRERRENQVLTVLRETRDLMETVSPMTTLLATVTLTSSSST